MWYKESKNHTGQTSRTDPLDFTLLNIWKAKGVPQ